MRDNVRVAVPVIDTPEYGTAAETATREQNAGYITVMLENGCAASDVVAEDGRVDDSDRVMFLFAWGDGYGDRFGLIYPDLCRLRHPATDSQAQRRVVPGGGRPERRRVAREITWNG
jgi:hypothetical protein